jgi:hypothetical protein
MVTPSSFSVNAWRSLTLWFRNTLGVVDCRIQQSGGETKPHADRDSGGHERSRAKYSAAKKGTIGIERKRIVELAGKSCFYLVMRAYRVTSEIQRRH